MSKTMICNCKEWRKYIPQLDGAITLAWGHRMWSDDFKSFIFCPYCGKKLTEEKKNAKTLSKKK